MKKSIFDLLKVGIGPSSSHTLGPMKMAHAFRDALLNAEYWHEISQIRVILSGSLAFTGEGHLTPNAIVAGLCGYDSVETPIEKIQKAYEEVSNLGFLKIDENKLYVRHNDFIHFNKTLENLKHPNTASFVALNKDGVSLFEMDFCSIGGGLICSPDEVLTQRGQDTRSKLSMSHILEECSKMNMNLLTWVLNEEIRLKGNSETEIFEELNKLWQIMKASIESGLNKEGLLPGKLGVYRRAKQAKEQLSKNSNPLQTAMPAIGKAGIYALAVSEENASGGRVITAPTCGACGVVPGVLYMLHHDLGINEKDILKGLLIAGLIGSIVVDRASISGAEVGCQGEVGVACAMAAGACVMINGGTNEQIEEAAEAALEHHLGLTCDPVMGLVQIPCIERNAIASGTAINSANLALLGRGKHLISFDECVDAMMATGCDMPEAYKETSLGGLATTHC